MAGRMLGKLEPASSASLLISSSLQDDQVSSTAACCNQLAHYQHIKALVEDSEACL